MAKYNYLSFKVSNLNVILNSKDGSNGFLRNVITNVRNYIVSAIRQEY